MILKRLNLENFRQHLHTEIEFESGMTAIVGPNGSGKSTLLEAIGYALYAENRANKDQIPSYWQESKKFSVTLEFELDGILYRATRTESKALLEEKVNEAWEERAEGPKAVTGKVEKILGLNFSRFKNSFCALQKELEFFKGTAANRRDEITKMLGLDDLRSAENAARERFKRTQSELSGFALAQLTQPEALARDLEAKERQIAEFEQRLAITRAELITLESQLPILENRAAQAQTYLDLRADRKLLSERGSQLQKQFSEASSQVTILTEELRNYEALQPRLLRYLELEKEIKAHEQARDDYQSQAQSEAVRQAEILRIQARLTELEGPSLQEAELKLLNIKTQRSLHQAKLAEAAHNRENARIAASNLRSAALAASERLKHSETLLAAGKCPECGQPFTGDFQQRMETERLQGQAQSKQLLIVSQEEMAAYHAFEELKAITFEAEIAAAESDFRRATEVESLQAQLTKAQQEKVGNLTIYDQEAHTQAKNEQDNLKADYERALGLAQVPQRLTTAKETQSQAQALFDQAKSEAQKLDEAIKATGITYDEEAKTAISASAVIHQSLKNIQTQITDLTQYQTQAQKDRQNLLDQKDQQTAQAAKRKALEAQSQLYREAEKQFKALRESLNRQLQPLIKERAENILSDLTGSRYNAIELDDKFDAAIIEDGRPKAVISGGEEDVLALSLRLALCQLIQERQGRSVGLLILDEVFGSLDDDRRGNVLESLDNLKGLTGSFTQIIAISHIQEINEVADQCLYLTLDTVTHTTTVSDQPPGFDPIADSIKTGLFA